MVEYNIENIQQMLLSQERRKTNLLRQKWLYTMKTAVFYLAQYKYIHANIPEEEIYMRKILKFSAFQFLIWLSVYFTNICISQSYKLKWVTDRLLILYIWSESQTTLEDFFI